MQTKVVLLEKNELGDMRIIDERMWEAGLIAMLEHANYLLVQDQEYEMVEGRLNVDKAVMEVLVVPVQHEEPKTATKQ